jgi:hypothetical protein
LYIDEFFLCVGTDDEAVLAKEECKDKIILDVHENLRIFFKYYYYIGFKTTNKKCTDNPFWVETELIV